LPDESVQLVFEETMSGGLPAVKLPPSRAQTEAEARRR
jgi:hypothetical protein